MRCFADTSALYALLNADDEHHSRAAGFFDGLDPDDDLVSHNYVVVELTALVQHRLGVDLATRVQTHLIPRLELRWVDREIHETAVATLLTDRRRELSLVDRVSFEVMRREELTTAFAFDPDFETAGFRLVPEAT